jgi:hypothetical protein
MDEQRLLDAVENVASELERLRLLFEFVNGVKVVEEEGTDPYVVPQGPYYREE